MWLFLRGEWDKNNRVSFKNDTDMWVQLFRELAGDDQFYIWYKGYDIRVEPTHIFARGGHSYYLPILDRFPKAYKIRYGAGERFMPERDYELILVDTPVQRQKVSNKYSYNVHLWVKPAANCFKPIETDKEYDVCYIANPAADNQAEFKRLKWVYDTAPRDLKILHLGNSWKFKPPKNVTVKRLSRLEMPQWINKCRIGICPYTKRDSAPRALVEMNACGLTVVCLEVNIWHDMYNTIRAAPDNFWDMVKDFPVTNIPPEKFSVKSAANYLKDLIWKPNR